MIIIIFLWSAFQDAPLHLLGRNHPLVKEAEKIPFKKPSGFKDFGDPFSIYYSDDESDYQVYNYDDRAYVDEPAEPEHIPKLLPIINHRENNGFEFLPTPLPETSTLALQQKISSPAALATEETLFRQPRFRSSTMASFVDPLPLTTARVVTTTPKVCPARVDFISDLKCEMYAASCISRQ